MKNITSEWFVRDSIAQIIDDNVISMAKTMLDNGYDDDNYNQFLSVASRFLDLTEMTAEEIDHLHIWMSVHCAIEECSRVGVISSVGDILELIKKS